MNGVRAPHLGPWWGSEKGCQGECVITKHGGFVVNDIEVKDLSSKL